MGKVGEGRRIGSSLHCSATSPIPVLITVPKRGDRKRRQRVGEVVECVR